MFTGGTGFEPWPFGCVMLERTNGDIMWVCHHLGVSTSFFAFLVLRGKHQEERCASLGFRSDFEKRDEPPNSEKPLRLVKTQRLHGENGFAGLQEDPHPALLYEALLPFLTKEDDKWEVGSLRRTGC